MNISPLTFLLPAGVITLLVYVLRFRSRAKKSLPPSQAVKTEAHDNIMNQKISKGKESQQEITGIISDKTESINKSTPFRRTFTAPDLIPGTKNVSKTKKVKHQRNRSDLPRSESPSAHGKGISSSEAEKQLNEVSKSSSFKQAELLSRLMRNIADFNINSRRSIKNKGTTSTEPFKYHDMLEKLDSKARMNILCESKDAKSCTFCVNVNGGKVVTPFCELVFLFGAVVDDLEITMTAGYDRQFKTHSQKPKEESDKLYLTPDVFFTSKRDTKFNREVEVTFFTHFGAIDNKSHLKVQIERTEHCTPLVWVKITEVKNWHDSIKFRVLQFCGLHAVCNICQKSMMTTRINYLLTTDSTYVPTDKERCLYLYLYTDSPDICQKQRHEMQKGNHQPIHPEQSKTVRFGCNLMAYLLSSNMGFSPCHEILEIENLDWIVNRCFLFTLSFMDPERRFQDTGKIPLKVYLSEIIPDTGSNMVYNCGPRAPSSTNMIYVYDHATGIRNTVMYPPTTRAFHVDSNHTKPMQIPGFAQPHPNQNSEFPGMEVHQQSLSSNLLQNTDLRMQMPGALGISQSFNNHRSNHDTGFGEEASFNPYISSTPRTRDSLPAEWQSPKDESCLLTTSPMETSQDFDEISGASSHEENCNLYLREDSSKSS